MTTFQDTWYLSLLGLAEQMRTSNPPKIRCCIQCLTAILHLNQPARIEARTLMQLGNVYYVYTKNLDVARRHLEKAFSLATTQNQFEDVIGETASLLAEIYRELNELELCRKVLWDGLELSRNHYFWQCRLSFQSAQLHVDLATSQDYDSACQYLTSGAELCRAANCVYTEAMFLLSKAMLFIVKRQFQDTQHILYRCSQLIDCWNGPLCRKEALKSFFLVLQVCQYLMTGQAKSVKPCLKQLQTTIQVLTKMQDPEPLPQNPLEFFQWMSKDHLCVLVYLVTVVHSMQSGQMDKAQKYAEKALGQLDKLKVVDGENSLLWTLYVVLLENCVMCRLVVGNNSSAIREICTICNTCNRIPRLLRIHRAQLHTLLGLYAMSMNVLTAAEIQFNTVLRITQDVDLWTFVNLNLAIIFLHGGREQEFFGLLDRITPERLQTPSESLKAASYYVKGLQTFFQNRFVDAKRHLRDALSLADKEDMSRISSCALVLLGHIFLSSGNVKDSLGMINPAMQVARSIPDIHIQLWGASLLKDIYSLCQDATKESECREFHTAMSQMLLKDQCQSGSLPEHQLITWTDGPCPINLVCASVAGVNDTNLNTDTS